MAEPVTVEISFFELVADYDRPRFHLGVDRTLVIQAIFDALKPWDPHIDDVTVLDSGKTSEQGISIKLPRKRVSLLFGYASCRLTRDHQTWALVDETITILDAALSALMRLTSVTIAMQKTTIGLHLQPRGCILHRDLTSVCRQSTDVIGSRARIDDGNGGEVEQ